MNPDTKTTNTKSFSLRPKKILIKGKERKIFKSLDIPLLPKKNNQKDTSTDKVN